MIVYVEQYNEEEEEDLSKERAVAPSVSAL